MRTEVKLGLAVGVILLAVLIGYVVLVPKRGQTPVTQLPPENPVESVAQDHPLPGLPTTAPAPALDGIAAMDHPMTLPASQPSVSVDVTGGVGAALPPAQVGVGKSADRWSVLDTGRLSAGEATKSPAGVDVASEAGTGTNPATAVKSSTTGGRTHVVQSGETLSSISASVYGSPNHYQRILRANPKLNPHRLHPGQVIVIPDLNESKTPAVETGASALPTTMGSSSESSTAVSSASATGTYRVQSGDSLRRISTKLYGRGDMWQKIYELNKETIGPDSGRLKLNMVLKLPAAPTAAGTH